MLWDLGNKKGSKGEAHTAYYSFARAKPSPLIIVSQGRSPHRLLHNKDRNNIENHKMKEEKNDRNGSK